MYFIIISIYNNATNIKYIILKYNYYAYIIVYTLFMQEKL